MMPSLLWQPSVRKAVGHLRGQAHSVRRIVITTGMVRCRFSAACALLQTLQHNIYCNAGNCLKVTGNCVIDTGSRTWRPIAEDSLGRVDAQLHKLLRVEHGQLHHLAHLLDLLLAAADVRVGHVWLLLHCHHGHRGIDLRRQRDLDLVLISVHPASSDLVRECSKSQSKMHTYLNRIEYRSFHSSFGVKRSRQTFRQQSGHNSCLCPSCQKQAQHM